MDRKYCVVAAVLFLCFLMAPFTYSQQTGTVQGRLVNGTDSSIVPAGVDLEVVSLSGGMDIIRTAKTDASGAFRIEGLPLDSMLMLRAVYKDANYNQQFSFDSAGKANVEMDVYQATTSMKDIRVEESQMVFQATGSQIQFLETVILDNATNPPRTFMDPSGNFRFSKPPEIAVLPQVQITAPGSSMPVMQAPLESPDGKSYYSLYPLRPGKTTFNVFQLLPYGNKQYTFTKKFYYRIPSLDIAVVPMDMKVSGMGLTAVRTDAEKNLAVYRSESIEPGTEVEWVFSGGTPVAERESSSASPQSEITSAPDAIARNAGLIVPVLLLGFILVLWYAMNRKEGGKPDTAGSRRRKLKDRREELLAQLADLDRRFEQHSVNAKEYRKRREEGKRMLRRISLLLNSSARD